MLCACFGLIFSLQRGEGEKGRECKFQNKAHRTFVLFCFQFCTHFYGFFVQLPLLFTNSFNSGSRMTAYLLKLHSTNSCNSATWMVTDSSVMLHSGQQSLPTVSQRNVKGIVNEGRLQLSSITISLSDVCLPGFEMCREPWDKHTYTLTL